MFRLRFSKLHGLGNDFILIDARSSGRRPTPEASVRWCDRHRGIGADGVLTLLPPRGRAACRLHIRNADGSVPQMCGNGLRAVIRYLSDEASGSEFLVDTEAGPRWGWRLGDTIRITLGDVRLLLSEEALASSAMSVDGVALSVGNPHLVLRPSPRDSGLLEERARILGPALEHHPLFPDRVNVGFLRPTGPRSLELAVFERGVGVTQACGTGAAAAAVAAIRWGLVEAEAPVEVTLPGGPLEVLVTASPKGSTRPGDALASVEQSGAVARVFDGELEAQDPDFIEPEPVWRQPAS